MNFMKMERKDKEKNVEYYTGIRIHDTENGKQIKQTREDDVKTRKENVKCGK